MNTDPQTGWTAADLRAIADLDRLERRLAARHKPDDPEYDAFYDATDSELAEWVPPATEAESRD